MSRSSSWTDTTAIFGGTFDPPHLGHLEAIRGLFVNPGLARILILPSPVPPHKVSVATPEQRLDMARLLLKEIAQDKLDVELNLSELERARGGAPTYSFDTIQQLKREIPNLAFVMGVDQLEKFHTWYRYSELLGLCHWLVLDRKPDGEERAQTVLRAWEASGLLISEGAGDEWRIPAPGGRTTRLKLVPTPARAISSTWIREQIARQGAAPENTLPESVNAYLKQRRIYGSS
jgi:nicotinate-nucleotide adenylyltransferase